MQSATVVSFTTTATATLTIVQSLSSNNSNKVSVSSTVTDATTQQETTTSTTPSRVDDATNKVGVYTLVINPGTHKITRAGSECGLLFASVKELDASQVIAPVIGSQWGDSYNAPSTVTITSPTAGATIYYTTDGTIPTTSSTLYSEPFKVSQPTTVKAFATKEGLTSSEVSSFDVTINNLRKVSYDFGDIQIDGSKPTNASVSNGSTVTLSTGRTYYINGKTQTGWKDADNNTYALGTTVKADKDYTFTPIFEDNQVALGDAATTVNWTFATKDGAPSVGYEGNVGYYTQQTTIGDKVLDVVMTVDARQDAGVSGKKGKFNTTSSNDKAQVNAGTVFIIPAQKGMTVTYTASAKNFNAADVTFNGENGTVSSKTVSFTYNGSESTLKIIDVNGNFYPSGLKVTYPEITSVEAEVNSTVGYGTLYYEKELKVPVDTKAYTATLSGNTLTLNELTDGIIPAKTAVVVSGNGGLFEVSHTGATFDGQNDLKGTASDIQTSSVEDGTVCVLGYENGKTAFYKYTGETLAANKAYIVVPMTIISNAQAIRLVLPGDATGISSAEATEADNDAPAYNLAGQRVAKDTKGIVIVNGKKRINK